MSERTRRRRAANKSPDKKSGSKSSESSVFHQGEDILRGAEKAQKEKGSGRQPFRFFLKGGEECEIIILDEALEKGIAFYEHGIWDGANKTIHHHICRKEVGDCPHCEDGDRSYYVLYLSVLVLKSFTTKSGVEVPHSKMLLPLKASQIEEFKQLQDSAKADGDDLRGMYLVMSRSTADKSPRIGKPSVLEGGRVYEIIPEDELEEDYGHDAVMSDDNKTVIRDEDYDITPYPYKEIFTSPEEAEEEESGGRSRRRRPRAGSQEEAEKEFEQEEEEEEEEEKTSRRRPRKAARKSATKGGRSRRRRAAAASDDDNPLED